MSKSGLMPVLWSRYSCMWQEMVWLWLVGSARWTWNNRCSPGEFSMKTWSSWGPPWTPAALEAAPYDARRSLLVFTLSPAISRRRHSVLWLSADSVCDYRLKVCAHDDLHTARDNFYQIWYFGEIRDKDDLVRFRGQKVSVTSIPSMVNFGRHLWEFHQLHKLCAVGENDELNWLDLELKRSKVKVTTRPNVVKISSSKMHLFVEGVVRHWVRRRIPY